MTGGVGGRQAGGQRAVHSLAGGRFTRALFPRRPAAPAPKHRPAPPSVTRTLPRASCARAPPQILPLLSELRAGNLVGNVEALTQVGGRVGGWVGGQPWRCRC